MCHPRPPHPGKVLTNLPWYYGIPLKETISAANLKDQLEETPGATCWDTDYEKICKLYLLFSDEAVVW